MTLSHYWWLSYSGMFSCMISQFFNCWDLLYKQSYKCYCWQWWSVRFKILEVNEEVSGKEVVSCKFRVSLKWILIKQFLKGKFQILYEVNGTILISTRQEFPPRPSYSWLSRNTFEKFHKDNPANVCYQVECLFQPSVRDPNFQR